MTTKPRISISGLSMEQTRDLMMLRDRYEFDCGIADDPSVIAMGRSMRRVGVVAMTMSMARRHATIRLAIGDVRNGAMGDAITDAIADLEFDRVDPRPAAVQQHLSRIVGTSYPAVLIGPGSFPDEAVADVSCEIVCRWVLRWNRTNRGGVVLLDPNASCRAAWGMIDPVGPQSFRGHVDLHLGPLSRNVHPAEHLPMPPGVIRIRDDGTVCETVDDNPSPNFVEQTVGGWLAERASRLTAASSMTGF